MATPSKRPPLTKGFLKRPFRAQCRILYHRANYSILDLANKYNRSEEYIKTVIMNEAGRRTTDDADEDYEFVDEETKAAYPPLVSTCIFPYKDFRTNIMQSKSRAGTNLKRKTSQMSVSESASHAVKKSRVRRDSHYLRSRNIADFVWAKDITRALCFVNVEGPILC